MTVSSDGKWVEEQVSVRCEWVFSCERVGLETVKGCPGGPVPYLPPSSLSCCGRREAKGDRIESPLPSLNMPIARSRGHSQQERWDMGLLSPWPKSNTVKGIKEGNAIQSVQEPDKGRRLVP